MADSDDQRPDYYMRDGESMGDYKDRAERDAAAARARVAEQGRVARENMAAAETANGSDSGVYRGTASVKDQEEGAHGRKSENDRYGPSARDDLRDRLGLTGKHRASETPEEDPGSLYKGKHRGPKDDGRKQLNKLFKSDSNVKKKLAIAGAAAGGSAVLGIFLFFALLPLKIESLVQNLEGKMGAEASQALQKETDNLERSFIEKHVLPNIGKGTCHTTLDAGCVSKSDSKTPFGKLFNAWRESGRERWMAENGFLIGKNKSGFYISINGNYFSDSKTMDSQVKEVLAGKRSFFDLSGNDHMKYKVTRSELRSFVREQFKAGTLWDKTYNRFRVGKLLETKYGLQRCVFFCNIRDKFADFVDTKKLAGQAILINRLVEPVSDHRAMVLSCILAGGDTCDVNPKESTGDPQDPERISPFEKDLRVKLATYRSTEEGMKKLQKIVDESKGISKDGLQKYMIKKLATAIVTSAGGGDAAAAVTADSAEKFLPAIGWVNTAASIIKFISDAGPKLRALQYTAVFAPVAVATFGTFAAVVGEMHTGHIDPTMLGALSDTLNNGNVDASTTPMFAHINETPTITTTSFLNNLLPGSAYAAAAGADNANTYSNTPYRCADGKGVKPTELVCKEEVGDGGNGLANDLTNGFRSIPGWQALSSIADLIKVVTGVPGKLAGPVLNQIFGFVGTLVSKVTGSIFGFFWGILSNMIPNPLEDAVTNGTSPKQNSTSSYLNLISPKAYADDSAATGSSLPSGGRIYDLMVAGADVAYNNSCQVDLGCAAVTDQQVADARNAQADQDEAEFNSRPLFARMFSTDTPYSMVSRLALTMPTNMLTMTNNTISTLFTDPITRLGTLFSTMLSGNHAFAAVDATRDAFHIPQVGYVNIPDDDIGYWEQNCINGPMGKYDAVKDIVDVSDWVKAQPVNETIGQAIPAEGHQNPCLLIHTAIIDAGVTSDPSMMPAEAQNSDAAADAAAAAADAQT